MKRYRSEPFPLLHRLALRIIVATITFPAASFAQTPARANGFIDFASQPQGQFVRLPAYWGVSVWSGGAWSRRYGSVMVSASTNLPDFEVFATDNAKKPNGDRYRATELLEIPVCAAAERTLQCVAPSGFPRAAPSLAVLLPPHRRARVAVPALLHHAGLQAPARRTASSSA